MREKRNELRERKRINARKTERKCEKERELMRGKRNELRGKRNTFNVSATRIRLNGCRPPFFTLKASKTEQILSILTI